MSSSGSYYSLPLYRQVHQTTSVVVSFQPIFVQQILLDKIWYPRVIKINQRGRRPQLLLLTIILIQLFRDTGEIREIKRVRRTNVAKSTLFIWTAQFPSLGSSDVQSYEWNYMCKIIHRVFLMCWLPQDSRAAADGNRSKFIIAILTWAAVRARTISAN